MKSCLSGRVATAWCTVTLILLIVTLSSAQIPDEFSNLQVLPEQMGKRELVELMREYSAALGVRCNHCHVSGDEPGSLEGYDFASDEPEAKAVARTMMRMTDEVNGKHLRATRRRALTRVRCVTCHRGLTDPETLDRILLRTIERQDVEAASDRYRRLREEYGETGSYDFAASTLREVAERRAQQAQDADGAIALLELNVEFHPDDTESFVMLGQLHAAEGDAVAARRSLERALNLDPDNRRAMQILARLGS